MNPFAKTYKIIENTNLDGQKYYHVRYGNIFGNKYLCTREHCPLWTTVDYAEERGGKYSNLEEVKLSISKHQESLLKTRLAKITQKTIATI